MSDYICPYTCSFCPYTCSYRTNSGFCGHTGGWERCQYRQLRQPNTVVGYVPSLIKTNSDRIRAMSDEEMAEWIYLTVGFRDCPIREDRCFEDCENRWLDWLRQEATDG